MNAVGSAAAEVAADEWTKPNQLEATTQIPQATPNHMAPYWVLHGRQQGHQ